MATQTTVQGSGGGAPTAAVLRGLVRPRTVHRWALASLAANVGLVVTGGAVRLTASGLGCPTWPRCTESTLVPTGEMGLHGVIEFGNRLLALVLLVVAVGTLVAAWRRRPVARDQRALAVGLLLGVPLQGVIGGLTVLTGLNPWVVMLHFLASMVMVAVAVVLVRRTGATNGSATRPLPVGLRGLAAATLVVAATVVYLGTVVTASGPHAGDLDARRTGLDPQLVSQIHADGVFLLVGLTVALLVALHAMGASPWARRAAAVLLAVELAQGIVGYTQYFLGLPELLVGLHLLGASLTVAAATDLVLATRASRGAVLRNRPHLADSASVPSPPS